MYVCAHLRRRDFGAGARREIFARGRAVFCLHKNVNCLEREKTVVFRDGNECAIMRRGACLLHDGNERASANGFHVRMKHSVMDISVRRARAGLVVRAKRWKKTMRLWVEARDRAIKSCLHVTVGGSEDLVLSCRNNLRHPLSPIHTEHQIPV